MSSKKQRIQTTSLCDHGCGNIAQFKNVSGKITCLENSSSCPAIRKRNSDSVINSYRTGKKKPMKEVYESLSSEKKEKMNWNKDNKKADFSYNGKGNHKGVLILERGHRCESCKLPEWLGKPITLELEHIDGDRKNNIKSNLKLLCPNCHSQTPTWKIGNKGGGWKVKKYSDEEMIEAITSSTCLNQVLTKLDLRYGSAQTIVEVMVKYKVNFKDV